MAEHGGHHRAGKVTGQRGVHRRSDHVRQSHDGQRHIGPASAQTAGIALDVDAVSSESVSGRPSAGAVLGEDHGVVRVRPVDLGGGLEHDAAYRRRLLAGREQLHGTHDVEFLEGGAPTRTRHVGGGGGVYHGVDVTVADHLGDEGVADVGANEIGPAHPSLQVLAGSDRVDGDDLLNQRVLRQSGGEVTAEEAAGTGHQDHPGVISGAGPVGFHHRSLSADTDPGEVRRGATCRVFCAGPGFDATTCGASSWTCACAAS